MKLLVALAPLLLQISANEQPQNKTKRTVGPQLHSVTDNRPPILLYNDNSGAGPAGINGFYAPVTLKPVFDPEVPKQVAHQQVVYEFQQTPTNAVSNVHVNQFYQPIQKNEPFFNNQHAENQAGIASSESVALPVQHSSLVRHGQYQQPHHIQTQQYVPGKYLYVNGKIVYQPNQQLNQPLNQQVPALNQQVPRPLAYLGYNVNNQQGLAQKLTPPPVTINNYRRFHPPQPHQIQKITKPMGADVTEEQEEEVTENNGAEEEDEEGDDEGYEDDESDDDKYFGRYSFDDDEDEHSGKYRGESDDEEEEDEDNERRGSRYIPKKQVKNKKKKNKYDDNDNYKYSEKYSSSSKYENKPSKKKKKSVKKTPKKMHYKAVKFTRELNGKPRIEQLQGKQSQNVPVVHKQKIFKEKWYVTKSTDDSNISS